MAQHILMDAETGDPKVRLKGNEHGAALVTLIDPDTGEPYAAGGGGGTTGGLTDDELRAAPVPVSTTALPASLGAKAGSSSLSVTQATGALTSVGGSVTTGGTAQVLAAANSVRRGITLQNTSTGDLRVSPWGTASSTAGFLVAAGALLVLDAPHCGVGAISIWGATTAQTFVGGEAV